MVKTKNPAPGDNLLPNGTLSILDCLSSCPRSVGVNIECRGEEVNQTQAGNAEIAERP
jgi:hypothetical protein